MVSIMEFLFSGAMGVIHELLDIAKEAPALPIVPILTAFIVFRTTGKIVKTIFSLFAVLIGTALIYLFFTRNLFI